MKRTNCLLRSRWAAACCLAMLAALAGCGGVSGGKNLTQVTGKVTYKGQALAKGRVTFMPLQAGDSASGEVVDGAYTLSTYEKGDGAPPGKYKVAVSSWKKEPDMQSQGEPAIPTKYFNADQSQLTAEVTNKASPIDFELK